MWGWEWVCTPSFPNHNVVEFEKTWLTKTQSQQIFFIKPDPILFQNPFIFLDKINFLMMFLLYFDVIDQVVFGRIIDRECAVPFCQPSKWSNNLYLIIISELASLISLINDETGMVGCSMCENMQMVFYSIDPVQVTVFVFQKTIDKRKQFRPSIFWERWCPLICWENDMIKELCVGAHGKKLRFKNYLKIEFKKLYSDVG